MASVVAKCPRKGATVQILGLVKAKHFNGSVGEVMTVIMGGRLTVKLFDVKDEKGDQKVLRLKPENMKVMCSNCRKASEGTKLLKCSRCLSAQYCSSACQRSHWKEHKSPCKVMKKEREERRVGDVHESWKKLSSHLIRHLQKVHVDCKCTTLWPVSCETDRLLEVYGPSFVTAHPNMIFKIVMLTSEAIRTPDGRSYPKGRPMPVITEDTTLSGKLKRLDECHSKAERDAVVQEYRTHVPMHFPSLMRFCVIGEVVFTKHCLTDLSRWFNSNKGKFFDWPEAAALLSLCPATGKVIEPDNRTKHIMVAGRMCGMKGVQGMRGISFISRIFPRIITMEGYEKMMGPMDNPGRRVIAGPSPSEMKKAHFYPESLRKIGNMNCEFHAKKGRTMTASQGWEWWTEKGFETLWDNWLNEDFSAASSALNL